MKQPLLPEEKIFRQTMRDYKMLQAGRKILLAVSGGADSMALLHLTAGLRAEKQLELWVLTLDHGLRPESPREVRLVEEACAKLGIPCYSLELPVRETAGSEKISLEEAGSKLRRRLFQEYRQKLGADLIATGHHLDDQAETILLHIIRGSSEKGLRGIYPVAPEGLIRPLIRLSREDILNYCRERQIPFLEDSSNRDWQIPRNRVRGELLPLLMQYNPQIKTALSRLGENVREDGDFLDSTALELYRELGASEISGRISFDLKKLAALPPFWQKRMLLLGLKELKGDLKDLSRVNLKTLEQILAGRPGKHCPLPGDLIGEKTQTRLLLYRGRQIASPLRPQVVELPRGGSFKEWGIKIAGEILPAGNYKSSGPWEGYFDAGLLGTEILLRSRKDGDRYLPPGKLPGKAVKKFLQERKIARGERERIPILEKDGEIVWIVGLDFSRKFLAGLQSSRVYRLRAESL